MSAGTPRKRPVFGPESWSEMAGRPWSYWDLWFAGWGAVTMARELYQRSSGRQVRVKDDDSKHRSFAAVDRVEERLRNLDEPSLMAAQRLALYRAFHSAGLELADRTDDSHGNVG